jgi:magnesium-transporting ATPase (P-type)
MLLKRITGKNGGKSAPAPKVAKGAQRKAAPKVDFKGEDLGMRERVDKIYQAVESSEKGLSTQEANRRLQEYGPNALQSEETSKLLRFLIFFWNPLSWFA